VYGKPVIAAFLAVNGTPADYPGNGGFEFACHALDEVKGGIRIDRAAADTASDGRPVPVLPSATVSPSNSSNPSRGGDRRN
jgi:hypothetical protein